MKAWGFFSLEFWWAIDFGLNCRQFVCCVCSSLQQNKSKDNYVISEKLELTKN